MKNSSKYFENRECEYYPCHDSEHINCLFCFCPMYAYAECPGNPSWKDWNGKKIKDCTDCTFPHDGRNYELIMGFLKEHF